MFFYKSSAYDKWCEKVYGKALKQSGMVTYKELEIMFEKIELKPDSFILDIGCGLGGMTDEIARHYSSKAIGIDIDENMIVNARSTYKNRNDLEFKAMDAALIGSDNNKYDLICMLDTVYFNTTQDMLFKFLDSCLECLNTNGKIAVFSSYVPANGLNIYPLNYNEKIKGWREKQNITVESVCLSDDFKNFWCNAYDACLELNKIMQAEIPDSYEKLLIKCSEFSNISRRNPEKMSRWLNIISHI